MVAWSVMKARVAFAFDDGIAEESSRTSTLASGRTGSVAHPEWTPPWRITVGSASGLRLSSYVYREQTVGSLPRHLTAAATQFA